MFLFLYYNLGKNIYLCFVERNKCFIDIYLARLSLKLGFIFEKETGSFTREIIRQTFVCDISPSFSAQVFWILIVLQYALERMFEILEFIQGHKMVMRLGNCKFNSLTKYFIHPTILTLFNFIIFKGKIAFQLSQILQVFSFHFMRWENPL